MRKQLKGNQSWIFIGRTDAEAEAPIFWPSDVKNWLTAKNSDAGKDWRQEEKGMTKDEMVGWHHRLNGHGFLQALGVGDGQWSLACCSPWGCKKLDMTELTELIHPTPAQRCQSVSTWLVTIPEVSGPRHTTKRRPRRELRNYSQFQHLRSVSVGWRLSLESLWTA